MKYRLAEWDVAMPPPLVSYWNAWNENEEDLVRVHLSGAVDNDVDWNDPRDSFRGIDALEAAVHRLRSRRPDYRFVIVSEVDHHHSRYRYRWDMCRGDRILMEGTDIVTVDTESGLIIRVDGFFGHLQPTKPSASGVPGHLQTKI